MRRASSAANRNRLAGFRFVTFHPAANAAGGSPVGSLGLNPLLTGLFAGKLIWIPMSNASQLLNAIEQGDPHAADQLLPLVYDELRRLAAAKPLVHGSSRDKRSSQRRLVHEAYLRLVGVQQEAHWDSRGHFFAAAAEAMRRILVDAARRKRRRRHGGALQRVELVDVLRRRILKSYYSPLTRHSRALPGKIPWPRGWWSYATSPAPATKRRRPPWASRFIRSGRNGRMPAPGFATLLANDRGGVSR